MKRMRRAGMFAAGFAVMMIAGIATAQIGGFGDEAPPAETSPVEAPDETVIETTVTSETPKPVEETIAAEDDKPFTEIERDGANEGAPEPVKQPVVDTEPPLFEILYPEDGQAFERKEVVFEGVTDPDARVFAGEYEADVREDGSWRIVLWLQKGQNVATLQAVDPEGNISKDSVTVFLELPAEPKEETGDQKKDHEEDSETPKEEEPKEEEPKGEDVEIDFSIHQVYGSSDSPEPFEVFYGTGHAGLVIEIISPYGDKRVEVGESGKWEAKVVFREVPAGKTFEIVVETSDGHRKVFSFTRSGESEG